MIMKIGIIGAMAVEVESLKSKINNAKKEIVSGIEFVSGELCGKDVVVAQCGIGKVFAAICTEAMIVKYGVDSIINTGVAGTLSENIGILDMAISRGVVQHDMDTSPLGDPVGLVSGINVIEFGASERLYSVISAEADKMGIKNEIGVIASGDQFINNKEKKSFIRDNFGAIACEMEGAAIGHVCFVNGVDFAIIRSISDNASGDADMEYPEMVKRAAIQSEALVEATLRAL
jgi:adenosylhomocysteine nucleosidase